MTGNTSPRPKEREVSQRVNNEIRVDRVRAIDDEGRHIGILPINDALRLAASKGLDLVEVSPEADPPVCRIMDFGKYRYEQGKREKVSRKHQQTAKLKEIRFHPNIDPHDLEVKSKKAREFLSEGHKVRLTVRFKGREIIYPEHGNEVINQLIENVKDVGAVEMKPKMFGKSITLVIGPVRSRHHEKSIDKEN